MKQKLVGEFGRNSTQTWILIITPDNVSHYLFYGSVNYGAQKFSLGELQKAETILTQRHEKVDVKDRVPVFQKLLTELRETIKVREEVNE